MTKHRYTYLGDKHTRADLKNRQCDPVRRGDGKCILSTRMASALVRFDCGTMAVVARRRLRLNHKRKNAWQPSANFYDARKAAATL